MATVNIRQLDEKVVQRLKRRASDNNRSLESEARHILEEAVQDGMHEKRRAFLALAERLRRLSEAQPQTPSHLLIREDRDGAHGLP